MDPFSVLAFDPGGSTGYAAFEYFGPGLFDFTSGTITDPEHHTQIRHLIRYYNSAELPLTLISESFEFRQAPDSAKARKGLELISREYIGVMKLASQDWCIPFYQQQPSHRSFITHEKLQRLGQLHEPLHPNRHRHDALQHLVYYLVARKQPYVEEVRSAIKRTPANK